MTVVVVARKTGETWFSAEKKSGCCRVMLPDPDVTTVIVGNYPDIVKLY